MMRKWMVGCMCLCLVWLSATMLTGFKQRDGVSTAEHRLAQLWKLSESMQAQPTRWVVKINGEMEFMDGSKSLKGQVEEWSKGLLAGKKIELQMKNGKVIVSASWQVNGSRVNWMAVQREANRFFWVYQIEAKRVDSTQSEKQLYSEVQATQAKFVRQLNDLGLDYNWNGTVQGEKERQAKGSAQVTVEQLEQVIAKEVKLIQMEKYTDNGTYSASYSAPELGQGIVSGKHELHLQMAVHQISGTDQERVSIGLPLITTEY